MAYITKFNSSRMLRQIDDKQIEINHSYYKRKISYLSDQEIKKLLAYKLLLENTEKFINNYYNKIKDTKTFIFENKPSFHQDSDCKNLHSDFENIKIPQKIKERGAEAVEEFRQWCKEHIALFYKDKEAFMAMCCLKFHLSYPTDLIIVTGENSGIDYHKNYKLEELEKEIDNLIRKAGEYFYSSPKTREILSEFRNKMWLRYDKYDIQYNNTEYGEKDIKGVLQKQFSEFNEPTTYLVQEWLRIKLNPELKFEGRLLEQLGFKNCPVCYSDYDSSVTNYDDSIYKAPKKDIILPPEDNSNISDEDDSNIPDEDYPNLPPEDDLILPPVDDLPF